MFDGIGFGFGLHLSARYVSSLGSSSKPDKAIGDTIEAYIARSIAEYRLATVHDNKIKRRQDKTRQERDLFALHHETQSSISTMEKG